MSRFPKLLTGLFREFRNSYNEGVDLVEKDINKAVGDSTSALTKATTAETNANEAKTTADTVKEQFDRIVAETGESNAEIVQARGGEVNLNARLEKVNAHLAHTTSDLQSREINIMFPPSPLVGAKMDGVTDDTVAIQNLINSLINNGAGQGKIIVPKGTAIISNIVLPPGIVLTGVGRHTSILKGKVGSTGKMVTDNGNAAKIIITDLQLHGNNQNYLKLLDLGNNGIQFGTEGYIENLFARDCPSADAYDINGNVAFLNKLSILYCKSGLVLKGASNRVRDIVTLGNTAYGIQNSSVYSLFDGIEVEAPSATCVPFSTTSADITINSLLVSIGSNTHIENLVHLNTTEMRFSLQGLSVSLVSGATYGAYILHNGLQFLKRGDYEGKAFNYIPEVTQLYRINESVASGLTNRTLQIQQGHPSMLIGVQNDIADDVTIVLSGSAVNTQGKKYVIQNSSANKTVWVRGSNSMFIIVGSQNISMDTALGFPVRPRAQLTIDLATGQLSQAIATYSGTYGAIGSYPTTGKWFAGEVIHNQSSQLGVSKYYSKQCIKTGDYDGTPPVWEFINRV
ncbi:glycosyl hydrolase family 28-related protein [Bacillus sp. 1P02SD]|uniref:glycosyl hydrolase family 28-related protein n=1 Tax=Bacillus sp. 1P02SD TaxID=3132264 RepID=UPI0039A33C3E